MSSSTDIDKITNKLNRFNELQGQKLSYHEAGHVLVSYNAGISCRYISCQFQIIPTARHGTIEIGINSLFQVDHNIPNWLASALTYMQLGANIKAVSMNIGVPSQLIEDELKKYAQILVAGEVAEKYFRSIRLWFLRRQVMKYGVQLPNNQLETDYGRLELIQQHININVKHYRQNVKNLIRTENNFNVLKQLALNTLDRQVLYQNDIETILANNNFTKLQFQL